MLGDWQSRNTTLFRFRSLFLAFITNLFFFTICYSNYEFYNYKLLSTSNEQNNFVDQHWWADRQLKNTALEIKKKKRWSCHIENTWNNIREILKEPMQLKGRQHVHNMDLSPNSQRKFDWIRKETMTHHTLVGMERVKDNKIQFYRHAVTKENS